LGERSLVLPASVENLFANLQDLVAKFEPNRAHYFSKNYSQAQAKINFSTPLFKALGWDVENDAGLPHHPREAIVERGETEGRPDYSFRLAGQTKFFVEAKPPSEPLDAADPRSPVAQRLSSDLAGFRLSAASRECSSVLNKLCLAGSLSIP
jgi:hypothetical protein